MRVFVAFIVVLMILASCKKPEDRSCVKSAGDDAELVHEVNSFNKMDLGSNMKFILVQDTIEQVIVRGGENLVNFIQVDVTDGLLTIVNENKCNFLRSYKHEVEVEIHLINVVNVVFKGTKPLVCKDQLDLPFLTFVIEEGAGKCNLNVNCTALYMISGYGWGNYEVTGQTNYAKIEMRDNGFGDFYGLHIQDSATVVSSSSERIKINLDGTAARVEISSYGDIWYIGFPSFLDYNRYGEGDLIDKN